MGTFLSYWAFGVVYSSLFPLFGGWFPFFVFRFSVLHSVLFGLLAGLMALLTERLAGLLPYSRERLLLLLPSLFSMHFLGWFFALSNMQQQTLWWRLPLAIGGTGFLFLIDRLAYRLSKKTVSAVLVFLLIGLGGIGLKGFVIQRLPLSAIGEHVNGNLADPELEFFNIIYPFSLPLDESLSRYSILVPDLEPEQSIQMIVIDAMRKDYAGSTLHGSKVTPHIDSIREDGLGLSRYYVQSPWTKGSTATLFTGLYPHDHGVCLSAKNFGQRLPEQHRTLAERLNHAGFNTLGAVFVNHLKKKYGFDQGFDLWITPGNHYRNDYSAMQKLLLRMLRERPNKLFVYWHIKGPHSSYEEALLNTSFWKSTPYYEQGSIRLSGWRLSHPKNFTRASFEQFVQKRPSFKLSSDEIKILRYLYNAQLNFVDREHVGRMRRALKGLGLYDQSLVTVTADHGEDLFDLGFSHGHYDQRHIGHLSNLRELVVNVPLIMKPPSRMKPSTLQDSDVGPVETVDLTTTLSQYAGVSVDRLAGDSFLPLLSEGSLKSQDRFSHAMAENCKTKEQTTDVSKFFRSKARRKEFIGRDTLKNWMRIAEAVFVTDRWKLARTYWKNTSYLYDLKNDPDERKPVDNRPGLTRRLETRLLNAMGSDTTIRLRPGRMLPLSEREKKLMQGLGYIQ